MSTRDIVDTFKEIYGADVSPKLVSKVTDAVLENVVEWRSLEYQYFFEPRFDSIYFNWSSLNFSNFAAGI